MSIFVDCSLSRSEQFRASKCISIERYLWLTCYFQRSIAADSFAQVVAGHADIGSLIWFAPSPMNDAQEEKRAAGQQHAVRTWIVFVRFYPLAILVPLHCRSWPPLCFTVESGWLTLGYNQVRRVLHNPGWGVLLAKTGSWQKKKKCDLACEINRVLIMNWTSLYLESHWTWTCGTKAREMQLKQNKLSTYGFLFENFPGCSPFLELIPLSCPAWTAENEKGWLTTLLQE